MSEGGATPPSNNSNPKSDRVLRSQAHKTDKQLVPPQEEREPTGDKVLDEKAKQTTLPNKRKRKRLEGNQISTAAPTTDLQDQEEEDDEDPLHLKRTKAHTTTLDTPDTPYKVEDEELKLLESNSTEAAIDTGDRLAQDPPNGPSLSPLLPNVVLPAVPPAPDATKTGNRVSAMLIGEKRICTRNYAFSAIHYRWCSPRYRNLLPLYRCGVHWSHKQKGMKWCHSVGPALLLVAIIVATLH